MRLTPECSAAGGLEQEVARLAVLPHEPDAADHRNQQPLGVHVAGLDLGRVNLAGEHGLHLLAVGLEVGPIHHRRPDRRREVGLAVAHEVGKAWVQLPEVAVQADDGHRLRHIVEARPRLSRGPAVAPCEEGAAWVVAVAVPGGRVPVCRGVEADERPLGVAAAMARRLHLARGGTRSDGCLFGRLGGLVGELGLLLGRGGDLREPAGLLAGAFRVTGSARGGGLGADRPALDLAHAVVDARHLRVHARLEARRALDGLVDLGGGRE
jgi:hypothetical protein